MECLSEKTLKTAKQHLEWFVGFSEAEASFSISKEGNLSFRINLHSDDLISLKYIKNLLSKLSNRDIGIIVESKKVTESYYSINKFQDIYEVIIPIFNKYFFTTSKYLDFSDFQRAAEIKAVAYLENRSINSEELSEILKLKSKINTKRINFDVSTLPKRELTPNRLLGFIEGDGSFTITNKSPELYIGIHIKNVHFLYEISEFFEKLPYNPSIGCREDMVDSKPKPVIRISEKVGSLAVFNILQIFNYILPFFKSLEFKSRKSEDFIY